MLMVGLEDVSVLTEQRSSYVKVYCSQQDQRMKVIRVLDFIDVKILLTIPAMS